MFLRHQRYPLGWGFGPQFIYMPGMRDGPSTECENIRKTSRETGVDKLIDGINVAVNPGKTVVAKIPDRPGANYYGSY
jgi:hypothetical protein